MLHKYLELICYYNKLYTSYRILHVYVKLDGFNRITQIIIFLFIIENVPNDLMWTNVYIVNTFDGNLETYLLLATGNIKPNTCHKSIIYSYKKGTFTIR